jgi:organic radical activating enzyme
MSDTSFDIQKGLPVMEFFETLQGEGAHTGSASFFLRLGGCDVGCHWCDVKESWDASAHPFMTYEEIEAEIAKAKAPMVVVTGGEPLMYDLTELTARISKLGKRVHVETSGAHPLSGTWDWICFSPKKFKKPLPEYYAHAHELKVVAYNKSDFQWAEDHAVDMNYNAVLFLQPEWSRREQMMPRIVEYIKLNPKWRVSLQTHKYLNIP